MHGVITDCAAYLQGIGESLDLGEPLLEVHLSLLDPLTLRLLQLERVGALPADAGCQTRDGILKEGVADVADTGGVVIVLVIVGESTPLTTGVDNAITNLLIVSMAIKKRQSRCIRTTRPQVAQTMSPLLNSSVKLGGSSLQSGHSKMLLS